MVEDNTVEGKAEAGAARHDEDEEGIRTGIDDLGRMPEGRRGGFVCWDLLQPSVAWRLTSFGTKDGR